MHPTIRLLTFALITASVCAQNYSIDQPLGPDTFGARSGGQTFTPSVGIMPSPGTPATIPLTKFTLNYGNLGALMPSATTFLNIYDGDPNNGGTFIGSSTNSIDTTAAAGLNYGDDMVWQFTQLSLAYSIEHWAIMSDTDTAGSLPLEVTLQTADRNGPDVYPGGAGIIGNLVAHPNGVDATFSAEFVIGFAAFFTTSGTGCPSSVGMSHLSAPAYPQLGQTFLVQMDNLSPVGFPLMVLGVSDTIWSGIPLPFPVSLAVPAAASCNVLVSIDVVLSLTPAGNTATLSFPIPNNMALLGFTVYQQGVQLEAGPDFSVTEKGIGVVGY